MGQICTGFEVNHGNRREAASSSRAASRLLPRRRVNSVADVERLDHCQEVFACEHAQGYGRGNDVQGIDLLNIAGHRGILRHLCPSAFQPGSGDRGSKRVEAVSHDSHQFPILQLKKRQPFGQITNSIAADEPTFGYHCIVLTFILRYNKALRVLKVRSI